MLETQNVLVWIAIILKTTADFEFYFQKGRMINWDYACSIFPSNAVQ